MLTEYESGEDIDEFETGTGSSPGTSNAMGFDSKKSSTADHLASAAITGLTARQVAKAGNPFKVPSAVKATLSTAGTQFTMQGAKQLGLKGTALLGAKTALKTAGKFVPILGWAFLAYDTYSYGSQLIEYFKNRKKDWNERIYTPISVIYSQKGPEQEAENDEFEYTDPFKEKAYMIYLTKYEIISKALRGLGSGFVKRNRGRGNHTLPDVMKDRDGFSRSLKQLSSFNFSGKYTNKSIEDYRNALKENKSISTEDANKYVEMELNRLETKNKLFLTYLSETKNPIYIELLEDILVKYSKEAFRKLIMFMFVDQDFLNYVKNNETELKKIGPIFTEENVKLLKEGKLNLNEASATNSFLNSPEMLDEGEDASGEDTSLIGRALGSGTMKQLASFINRISRLHSGKIKGAENNKVSKPFSPSKLFDPNRGTYKMPTSLGQQNNNLVDLK